MNDLYPKISIQYDATLSDIHLMCVIEELVSKCVDCWIFVDINEVETSKVDANDIIKFANKLRIPIANVHFAYANSIIHFINSKAIDIHISDDICQLLAIRYQTCCIPISSLANPNFHQQCITELQKLKVKCN